MPAPTLLPTLLRRVVLLQTDERAGLVAALTAACAARSVSLDIVTGPGHVLVTFDTDDMTLSLLLPELQAVGGVVEATPYTVL